MELELKIETFTGTTVQPYLVESRLKKLAHSIGSEHYEYDRIKVDLMIQGLSNEDQIELLMTLNDNNWKDAFKKYRIGWKRKYGGQ